MGKVSKPVEVLKPKEADVKSASEETLKAYIHEMRMEAAMKAYQKQGTFVNFVGTLSLSKKEKADFLDEAMTRMKGAPPKCNPFKEG